MSQIQRKKKFKPDTTVYHSSSKIHPGLLDDIIDCYEKGIIVCKYCYYRKTLTKTVVKTKDGIFCNTCSSICTAVWLIPASQYCENYCIDNKYIPIPPTPKWTYERKDKPFTVCQRKSHYSCFEMSATAEVWFAHSIEELVIWTIEREFKCTFRQYIEKHNRGQNRFSKGSIAIKSKQSSNSSSVQNIEGTIDPSTGAHNVFEGIARIPKNLLQSVIDNYKKAESCCRYCFYYKSRIITGTEETSYGAMKCRGCNRRWNSIKVISASKMCRNFGNFKKVPISIPAIEGGGGNYPHEYCNKSNHYNCFERFAENGFKYAHSIEELVVWTVEKETVGYGNFSSYIKGSWKKQTISGDSNIGNHDNPSPPRVAKYKPSSIMFPSVSSIPSDLLNSVCECYSRRLMTCKACFFESIEDGSYNPNPTLSSKEEGSSVCEKGHFWKAIRVIPSSELCESYASYIGVPPFPRHMYRSKAPFQVCNFKDHNVCYNKTREKDPWFPHTVEEIVIWTVEREMNADFGTVFEEQMSPAHVDEYSLSLSSSPLPTSPAQAGSMDQLPNNIEESNVSKETDIIQQELITPQQYSIDVSDTQQPLLFMDDEEDNEEPDPGVIPLPQLLPHDNNDSTLGGFSLQEAASYFFPALKVPIDSGVMTMSTNTMVHPSSTAGGVGLPQYIDTQLPGSDKSVGGSYPLPVMPSFPPTVGGVVAPSVTPPRNTVTPPVNDLMNMSSNDESSIYECYLCYREFESAKKLANHTTKPSHIELMKKDFYHKEIWRYQPYPPDQGPSDFALCTRSTMCPGKVKCGSAHSLDEVSEWNTRYSHRQSVQGVEGSTPQDVIKNCDTGNNGVANPESCSLKISIKPGSQCASTTPKWKITINGQGWLSLLGVECCHQGPDAAGGGAVKIAAIKGDTIYTINPWSNLWVAATFEEAILLGKIVLVVKGIRLAPGSHDCQVKLHLGMNKYCVIDLKAFVKY